MSGERRVVYQPFDLTGKVALVTGGNGGIGLGMARAMAEAGRGVAHLGHQCGEERRRAGRTGDDRAQGRGAAMRCGRRSRGGRRVRAHARRAGPRRWLFRQCRRGRRRRCIVPGDDREQWHRVLRVNLDGAFYTFRAAARHMVQRGGDGVLVGTASLAAIEGSPRSEHYAATKGGMISMVRALAVEFARHGCARPRDPAGLDRDRHDAAAHHQRQVPRARCCRACRCGVGESARISAASRSICKATRRAIIPATRS